VICRSDFEEIQAISMDSALDKIKTVDFLKMDIEGAEIEAIQGCKEIMKKFPLHFAIGSYHIVDDAQTYIFLEKYFKKHGYKSITNNKETDHFSTYAFKNINN